MIAIRSDELRIRYLKRSLENGISFVWIDSEGSGAVNVKRLKKIATTSCRTTRCSDLGLLFINEKSF